LVTVWSLQFAGCVRHDNQFPFSSPIAIKSSAPGEVGYEALFPGYVPPEPTPSPSKASQTRKQPDAYTVALMATNPAKESKWAARREVTEKGIEGAKRTDVRLHLRLAWGKKKLMLHREEMLRYINQNRQAKMQLANIGEQKNDASKMVIEGNATSDLQKYKMEAQEAVKKMNSEQDLQEAHARKTAEDGGKMQQLLSEEFTLATSRMDAASHLTRTQVALSVAMGGGVTGSVLEKEEGDVKRAQLNMQAVETKQQSMMTTVKT